MRPAGPMRERVMIQMRTGHVQEPDSARGGLVDDGFGNMVAPNDGYGNLVSEWQDIRAQPFAANIVPMRGNEGDVSGANTDVQVWMITLRWHSLTKNISNAFRLVNCRTNETYNIVNHADFTQKRRSIKLTCESGKADG